MRTDPFHMLKRLDPPVRPVSSGRSPNAPLESRGFDELLTLVARGEAHSELPVSSELTGEHALSEAEQARLGEAADLAEAAGFATALVLLDGRSLVLDVAARRVMDDLADATSRTIALDGAVRIVTEEDTSIGPRDPRAALMPPAVASRHGFDQRESSDVSDTVSQPSTPLHDSRTPRGDDRSFAA